VCHRDHPPATVGLLSLWLRPCAAVQCHDGGSATTGGTAWTAAPRPRPPWRATAAWCPPLAPAPARAEDVRQAGVGARDTVEATREHRRPLIYVYDLPRRYTAGLIEVHDWYIKSYTKNCPLPLLQNVLYSAAQCISCLRSGGCYLAPWWDVRLPWLRLLLAGAAAQVKCATRLYRPRQRHRLQHRMGLWQRGTQKKRKKKQNIARGVKPLQRPSPSSLSSQVPCIAM